MPEKNGKEPIKSLYTMFKYIYNHIYIYRIYDIVYNYLSFVVNHNEYVIYM